jgi:hypothetical protein
MQQAMTTAEGGVQEVVEVEVPGMQGKRGCSVVDISAAGKICRCDMHGAHACDRIALAQAFSFACREQVITVL